MTSRKTAAKETNYSLDKYYQNLLSYSVNSDSSSAKKVLDSFVHWPEINNMKCNTDKSKEVSTINLRCSRALPSVRGIEQLKELTELGLTLQDDCKYSVHARNKLWEANKCLFIIKISKEGRIYANGSG